MYPGSWNIPLVQASYLQNATKFSWFLWGDQVEYRARLNSPPDADDVYQKLVDAQPQDQLSAKSHAPELLLVISLLNLAVMSPKFLRWWSIDEDGSDRLEWDGSQFTRTEVAEGGDPGWRLRVQSSQVADPFELVQESALEFCPPEYHRKPYTTYKPQGAFGPYGQRVLQGFGCLEAGGLDILRMSTGTIEKGGHEFPCRHHRCLEDEPLLVQERHWREPREGLKAVISVCLPETPEEAVTFPKAQIHLYRYGAKVHSQIVDWSGIKAEAWLSCDEFEYHPATLALTGVEPHLRRLRAEAQELNQRSLELQREGREHEPSGYDLCVRPVAHSFDPQWSDKIDVTAAGVSIPLRPDGRLAFALDGSGRVTLFQDGNTVLDNHRRYRRMVIDTSADLRDTKDIYTVWAAFDDKLDRPQLAIWVGTVSVYDAGGPGWREQLKTELGECERLATVLGVPFLRQVSRGR